MENSIISKIRFVLINDWDPISIGDNSNLSDEYDGYIGPIMEILRKQGDVDELAYLLKKIENLEMGIGNTNIKKLYNVAIKLKKIGNIYYNSSN
ncbi:MAG: hypothetical protein LIP08_05000 [Bacteroides sp.]|nr:hypothetical protein [Bacteroides sp.]